MVRSTVDIGRTKNRRREGTKLTDNLSTKEEAR
jgi:hypothetical protein